MSHANRNFVIAYIALVGLPVAALVGVLKSGRTLTAPFSVDGAWKIQAVFNPAPSVCSNFFSSVSDLSLAISQSGKSLVVSLNGGSKTTSGTLDGKTLTAQFAGTDGAANCSDRPLTLTATLDPHSDPRTLSGKLSLNNCTQCSLEFRAVRQPRAAAGASH